VLDVYVIEPQPRTLPRLKTQKQVRVVGSVSTPRAAFFRGPSCDLILLSADFPAAEVLDFLAQRGDDGARVVIVEADESGEQLVPFLEAGAAGYVRKDTSPDEMVAVLQAIHAGKAPLSPGVGTALVERMHELLALREQRAGPVPPQNQTDLSVLTAREREILVLIRAGASNQGIAGSLMIELGTVKNHVHNILKKLNVRTREQAAAYADLLPGTLSQN
jgi:two-component system nitrate/nitrite response regulator NarL